MNVRIEEPAAPGDASEELLQPATSARRPTAPARAGAPELGIALLGCGVVGSAVARLLVAEAGRLEALLGARPVVRAVAVRHPDRPRDVPLDPSLFCDDPVAAADRDDVHVVIEVMGGVDPAGGVIEMALLQGKDVITANKELLARRRHCLEAVADGARRRLRYEASVMAGVPVVDTLARLAAGDRIARLEGILNGTTNFCLHRMESEGLSLAQALDEARALGYTEADPTADVEGDDAAAKLAILSSLAFGRNVSHSDVDVAGIGGLEPKHLEAVRAEGESVRLVAEAWTVGSDVVAQVAPKRIPRAHPLVRVEGHHNGLAVEAEAAGSLFFQGPGAGGIPTASAVIRDLASLRAEVTIR